MEFENFYNASKKAQNKIYTEFMYEQYLKTEGLAIDGVPHTWKTKFKEWKDKRCKNLNQRWKYGMLTVNFKDNIPYMLIKIKVKKAFMKKWIGTYIRRYECRGFEGDNFIGVHLHAQFEIADGKDPYQCKREFYNTFKDLVGNKKHVHMRYSNDEKAFVEYVKGFKEGQPKENFELDEKLNEYFEKL